MRSKSTPQQLVNTIYCSLFLSPLRSKKKWINITIAIVVFSLFLSLLYYSHICSSKCCVYSCWICHVASWLEDWRLKIEDFSFYCFCFVLRFNWFFVFVSFSAPFACRYLTWKIFTLFLPLLIARIGLSCWKNSAWGSKCMHMYICMCMFEHHPCSILLPPSQGNEPIGQAYRLSWVFKGQTLNHYH